MILFDFLKDHWEMCLSIFLFTLSLILSLIKKKPIWNQMGSIFADVFQKLPYWISLVEKDDLTGSEKLSVVLSLVRAYLLKYYKFDKFEEIESVVKEQIETILSTPQKKEV